MIPLHFVCGITMHLQEDKSLTLMIPLYFVCGITMHFQEDNSRFKQLELLRCGKEEVIKQPIISCLHRLLTLYCLLVLLLVSDSLSTSL